MNPMNELTDHVNDAAMERTLEPFLHRVVIRNYKSIGKCDVELARLTALVGRNGAGKSNFLDALRFVADGLQTSLDHAIKSRGGIQMVRRKSTGHPRNFRIELGLNLSNLRTATYGFEVAARQEGGFFVKQERLEVQGPDGSRVAFYDVNEGKVLASSEKMMPQAVADRLFLVVASGIPAFRGVYDLLAAMGFYNLNPEAMKEVQSPDAGELLHHDGDNIASVVARLQADAPAEKERVETYLSKIVSGVEEIRHQPLGPRETVEFRQSVEGSPHPWAFPAANMSDGTLRALGILVAVSQLVHLKNRVPLVGVEAPETALHPAAAQALMDALEEARAHTQILITTHSADLLKMAFDPKGLLAVQSRGGETEIAPIDAASREAIRNHLYSAGDMLRLDQLEPDQTDLEKQKQGSLFADIEAKA